MVLLLEEIVNDRHG